MARVTDSIDHLSLSRLVEAQAVRGADVVGQPGGWGIIIKYGMVERKLVTRSGSLRLFRKFDSLVTYLKGIGIAKYMVDAANYDPTAVKSTVVRPDASKRLKQAFQALEQFGQINEYARPRSRGEKA